MTAQAPEQLPIKVFALAIVMGLLGATASTIFLWIVEEGQQHLGDEFATGDTERVNPE